MLCIAIDLELNQPSGRIIQIGAAIADMPSGNIIDTFSVNVCPDEPISEFITALTGIRDEDVQNAVSLVEAYGELLAFVDKHAPFYCAFTWGGDDLGCIRRQLADENVRWPFGRRWLDVKTLYQCERIARGEKPQAGLAKALTRYGLKFVGRKHTAKDDAVNTLLMAAHLMKVWT